MERNVCILKRGRYEALCFKVNLRTWFFMICRDLRIIYSQVPFN